jgi:hypothetical protein
VHFSKAQMGVETNTEIKFFAQVMLHDATEIEYSSLETDLNANPYVFMVRLDRITNGLFIITQNVATFDETVFNGWIGERTHLIECYRDGIHGMVEILPFTSNFCNAISE